MIMSSILARIPVPEYTGYSASKAGLLGLVRSLAAELGPDNVQVNAICPGWVDTDMAWLGLDGIAAASGGTRSAARANGAAGRCRGHGGLAPLARWTRRHGSGDRSERRRLDGLIPAGRHAVEEGSRPATL